MLLTHRTATRTYTILIQSIDDGTEIAFGAAVCHEVNGETGEIIEEYDAKIGRAIAEYRLNNEPVYLGGHILNVISLEAFKAGHKVTLRDLLKEGALRYIRQVGYFDNDRIKSLVPEEIANIFIAQQEAEAWAEHEELSDDEWFDEAMSMGLLDSSLDLYTFYNDNKSY